MKRKSENFLMESTSKLDQLRGSNFTLVAIALRMITAPRIIQIEIKNWREARCVGWWIIAGYFRAWWLIRKDFWTLAKFLPLIKLETCTIFFSFKTDHNILVFVHQKIYEKDVKESKKRSEFRFLFYLLRCISKP